MRGSGVVWRALEAARRDNLRGAGEAAPVAATPGTTRRALLKGIVAAGALSALPRPARAFTGGCVAIIGGGIAGLSALHHLRQAGIDAHVYEARTRIGGRMFTSPARDGVPAFEIGGQLVNTDHRDMHMLASEFGVALIDRKDQPHRTRMIADGKPVSEAQLVASLRDIAGQIGSDADRLDKDYDRVARELDRLSIADYLDLHRDKVGAPWARRLLEATSRTEYGVEPAQASALELIFNLPTVHGERFDILSLSDERYVLGGGSGALIQAMVSRYQDRISTGKRLLATRRRGSTIRLEFLDGTQAEAESLIVAVPAPLTRQIDLALPLPAEWRRFIETMTLGRNEKIQAAVPRRVWQEALGSGGELWNCDGNGYSLGWDGSVHHGEHADPVWTWFLGGDETEVAPGAVPASARRFGETASSVIPGMATANLDGPFRMTGWHRDPLTLGGYVNYAPGQLTRFAHLLWIESDKPAERQHAAFGRIAFAGEHLSDAYPGYMNGAAQTGRMAAEALTGAGALRRAA